MRFIAPVVLVLLLTLSAACAAPGEIRPVLRHARRIVFVGDSITNAGMYVRYLDAYLLTRYPERRYELINLGLSSEGVTGLSEPEHPFPRPNVHERLGRVLSMARPEVLVACYGMNDGIYYPFSRERFKQYQAGILELVRRARERGVRVVLLTPPPFDPEPLRDRVLPITAPVFSWMRPYAAYDDVLERYAKWLLTVRGDRVDVVETHDAIHQFLAAARAKSPGYRLADDGVHMNASGHWIIARQILRAWDAPPEADSAQIDARKLRVGSAKIRSLTGDPTGVRFTWTSRLPMPLDPEWDLGLVEHERFGSVWSRHKLTITGLAAPRWKLFEGDVEIAEVSREDLARGLDLLPYPRLTVNRRAVELHELVRRRERLMSSAWLTAVGHLRPNTPAGPSLEEATRQATELTGRIRRLIRPAGITYRIRASDPPVG